MNKQKFDADVKNDWIAVDIIEIKDRVAKSLETKLGSVLVKGAAPKNIQEIENQRTKEFLKHSTHKEGYLANWDDNPRQGIVKGIGPDVKNVEIGDKIYFRDGAGEAVIYKKEYYLMIKPYDVYLVV